MEKKCIIDEQVEQVREFLLHKGYAAKTIIIFSRCWRRELLNNNLRKLFTFQ
jgi:hypothetical protein